MKRLNRINLLLRLGLALAVVAPGAAVAAPEGTEPVVIAADRTEPAAQPRGEQVLRLAGPVVGPSSLDPALVRELETAFLARQVFRGLTRLNDRLEPEPELAERIRISPDGLRYRFTLDPAATFQDGRPITADDVVYSFTRALDPETAGGERALLGGPTYLGDIAGAAEMVAGETDTLAGARAIDERTVELRLASPRATFLMKLAGVGASVVDRADVERGGEWWRAPNGSGPFRVAEWVAEERLVLAGYEAYHGGGLVLERVEVRLGPSALQPFNLYQAGEIDLARVPVQSLDRVLEPEAGLAGELSTVPMFAVNLIAFNPNVAPMDDPHLRRAVQLAAPREQYAEITLNGRVLRATGVVPHGMLGRQWPARGEPYDLDGARREIVASRYGSAERVPPIRIYGGSPAGAQALRDVLAEELGLRVEVIAVDREQYFDELARDAFSGIELYWGADYPDPESFLWSLFGSTSGDNYLDYENHEFDRLMRQAADTLDAAERAALYASAQELLLADHVVLPLYHDVRYTLTKPQVRGLEVTALGILALDDVWLER